MNRKWLFGIILSIVIISILIIIINIKSTKYNKYVISNDEWNKIASTRVLNTNIKIDNIRFNDYSLSLDKKSNTFYHNYSNKDNYNPSVDYIANEKVKIAFSNKISEDNIKIIIYNDKYYNEYSLVLTQIPILNIKYKETKEEIKHVFVDVTLYDNRIDTSQKVIKSDGKLTLIENNTDYYLSLKQESLGHNERDNNISIFGMDRHDKYVLSKTNINNNKSVLLFIEDEYKGIYDVSHRERNINNEPKQKNR